MNKMSKWAIITKNIKINIHLKIFNKNKTNIIVNKNTNSKLIINKPIRILEIAWSFMSLYTKENRSYIRSSVFSGMGQLMVPSDQRILEIDCDDDDDITDSVNKLFIMELVLVLEILRLLLYRWFVLNELTLILVSVASTILVILIMAIDTWKDDRALVSETWDSILNAKDCSSLLSIKSLLMLAVKYF